jgi:hypothetical protein
VSQSAFTPTPGVFFGDYTNIAAMNGKIYPIWMRLDGSTLSVWTALVTDSAAVTRQYTVQEGWNIVSLPMVPADSRKTVLFPTALSEAYEYLPGSGYQVRDTLQPGKAYWLQFGPSQPVDLVGFPLVVDTIDVQEGWNLIGSVDGTLQTSAVQTIPPGIIASGWIAYNDSGYFGTGTIDAARGYWVKTSAAGKLVLRLGDRDIPPAELPPRPVRPLGKWH